MNGKKTTLGLPTTPWVTYRVSYSREWYLAKRVLPSNRQLPIRSPVRWQMRAGIYPEVRNLRLQKHGCKATLSQHDLYAMISPECTWQKANITSKMKLT